MADSEGNHMQQQARELQHLTMVADCCERHKRLSVGEGVDGQREERSL